MPNCGAESAHSKRRRKKSLYLVLHAIGGQETYGRTAEDVRARLAAVVGEQNAPSLRAVQSVIGHAIECGEVTRPNRTGLKLFRLTSQGRTEAAWLVRAIQQLTSSGQDQ